MDDAGQSKLMQIAREARALVPCPDCGKGDISALDPQAEGVALTNVMGAWNRKEFPDCPWDEVTSAMKSLLVQASYECPECEATVPDNYHIGALTSTTEELDDEAASIYSHVENRDIKEIYHYISELEKFNDDRNHVKLLKLSVDSVLHDYQRAYHAEVAARRSAPIWQTEERKREQSELRSARWRISWLNAQLEFANAPEREWKRHQDDCRVTRAAQDRLLELERKVDIHSKYLIFGWIAFAIAVGGDVWAVLAAGDLYRMAGKALIGACGLVTALGPFFLYAVYKDGRTAMATLSRNRVYLERQAGLIKDGPAPDETHPPD